MNEIWARCAPFLDEALAHAGRTHALSDVAELIASGRAQLWATELAALVTLVEDDPLERRLLAWLGGGRLEDIVETLLPAAEAWGRGQGCRRALVIGRPGWERALSPDGYAPVARIIAKDLSS